MNELALFAGGGGGLLASGLLGWRTVCAVEIDEYRREVLFQRQRDGVLDKFPIWDDVRTFDGRPWRGCVDIVTGGFPCQDISTAGAGHGLEGERSGLWFEMARIIGEVQPRFGFVENSAALVVRGLGTVIGNLSEIGHDAIWEPITACAVGASHPRSRLFVISNAKGVRRDVPSPAKRRDRSTGAAGGCCSDATPWGLPEPGMVGVANGMASRVDRIRTIGNGQVPAVVVRAWEEMR